MKPDKNGLLYKFVDAEQYDSLYSEDTASIAVIRALEPKIGTVLVSFSVLEHSVEQIIAGLFNDRSSHTGMLVTKFMEYRQKVALFEELATSYLIAIESNRVKEVASLTKVLVSMGELRNIVAHAKWLSYSKDGYVRSQVKLNTETGMPKIKYFRLTSEDLNSIIVRMDNADDDLSTLGDRLGLM